MLQEILNWLLVHGLKILTIIIVAFLLKKFSIVFIEKLIKRLIVSDAFTSKAAEKKRENTLIRIFSTFLNLLIIIFSIIMVIQELGFAVAPLLAAVGVAGVAFGFGGQYLIKDLISGFFIIIENQYRIGDVVSIGSVCGIVEDITLRMTTVRDLDGGAHHIPHGEIHQVNNLSKKFSRVNLNIGISYKSDLEKVILVINKVGNDLAKDPEWKEYILKPPQFLRVDNFADSAIIIKILGETQPIHQWAVTGELRKRIKIAFDKNGIEIPFPQMVVHKPA
ncbi:MAG: mechanosensitive ion channel family protein [Candidatus Pacebacteria bacterium]|nr:mechanosensitive ion channel family protein [Candidatus Paceibacterota bacterium]